jgi:D-serine deaminase-like pyridoxal phosphate-dependent protein
MEMAPGSRKPEIGEMLFLIPRHVCPSVNNFDRALIVKDRRAIGMEAVTARGREVPMISSQSECAES